MAQHPRAFTIKSKGGLLRVLRTAINIFIPNTGSSCSVYAIWDTGATSCAISKSVVQRLGLMPTGMTDVHTANGIAQQRIYTIDIALPNGVRIGGITATEIDGLASNCDALIGMDVITIGDLSITNHNGVTCMSFRVPSCHQIDYVANPNFGLTPIMSVPPSTHGTNRTPPKKKRKKR